MNFFEHQDRARRNTGRLVALFVAAVIGLVAGAYALVIAFLVAGESPAPTAEAAAGLSAPPLWRPDVFAAVALGVGGVVGAGSLYKTAQLAGGGEPLALSLGGRRLLADSPDPLERKVLNVVEEMALAAGLPVPPVFMMDHEAGINAFAAGSRPEEAVIGLTRGCAEQLSRDELQGVVAHEFSHILNGDMRLNLRLIAIVHGILLLGLIGYYAFRLAAVSGGRRRSDDKSGGITAAIIVIGLGLMVVGFAGTLIGNLIKAAVSRQREFLADASAVQFTRNPDGIAGALKKIGGLAGSRLEAPRATEASHMFFASGVSALFATHPPLAERITRIDRFWNAERLVGQAGPVAKAGEPGLAGFAAAAGPPLEQPAPSPPPLPPPAAATPAAAVASVGRIDPADLARARSLAATVPAPLRDAAHEPFGSRAVVYLLLLDDDPALRERQLARLDAAADPAVAGETRRLAALAADLPREARLPLVDICLGPLKDLSPEQYARFRDNLDVLIAADERLSFFEWSLRKVVLHVLEPHFGRRRRRAGRPTAADVSVVFSAVARAGAGDDAAAEPSFARGAAATGLSGLVYVPWNADLVGELDKALERLARLAPNSKQRVLTGMAEIAGADGLIHPREHDLLRVVATTIDCPMPPLAG